MPGIISNLKIYVMAKAVKTPTGLKQEVIQAFATFTQIVDPKLCARNLRQLFFEFLKTEDCAGQEYFADLIFEMDAIFDLLQVIEDEGEPV
jgi:hypothetical protein